LADTLYNSVMKLKIIIAVVIVLLIAAVSAGAYFMTKRTNKSADVMVDDNNTLVQDSSGNVMQKKSLRDLLGMSTAQQCTYSDADTETSGTAYIANQKMRADFSTVVNGKSVMSHAIVSGDKMYYWVEGETQGFTMSTANNVASDDATYEEEATSSEGVNIDKEIDYKCSNWAEDDSMFEVPSDVEFQDLSSMMQETESVMKDEGGGVDCSICDSVPAEAVDQCRASLGCE
jgi:uncharacterized protein YxeA